jgi:hypothetical protein
LKGMRNPLCAVLKLGYLPEMSPTSLAVSRDPAILRVLKNAVLAEAQERAAEAVELGDAVLAALETERAESLQRQLDTLLPEPTSLFNQVPA